jgi:hypothetical protein
MYETCWAERNINNNDEVTAERKCFCNKQRAPGTFFGKDALNGTFVDSISFEIDARQYD